MQKPKILAISGSIRSNSINDRILQFMLLKFAELFDIVVYDRMASLPHFNPDLDKENPPEQVQLLRNEIAAADGVLICTPEYVFSLPGSLKNALEWNVSNTLFFEKPVALIVAAASGLKAMESLQLIMKTLGALIGKDATLLIQGAKGKLDGPEITDTQTRVDIHRLMESFGDSLVSAKERL